jgi:hypothetical protein
MWKQPLDSKGLVQITEFSSGEMFGFAWSKDGKQLAFARGVRTTDVVMMSNFRKTGSSLQPSEVLRTDLELCNPNCRFLSFGILHKDVQVTVVIEHTGVEQLSVLLHGAPPRRERNFPAPKVNVRSAPRNSTKVCHNSAG